MDTGSAGSHTLPHYVLVSPSFELYHVVWLKPGGNMTAAKRIANIATIAFLARYHETSEVKSQVQADRAAYRAECFALRARIAPDKVARRVAGCLSITFRLEADMHQARVTRHTNKAGYFRGLQMAGLPVIREATHLYNVKRATPQGSLPTWD